MRFVVLLVLLCACQKAPDNSCLTIIRSREGVINGLFARVPDGLNGQENLTAEKVISSLYWAEQATFDMVESCSQIEKDPSVYNEYHRGKMKFPSPIEQRHKRAVSSSRQSE
jgi:hypothetical protein